MEKMKTTICESGKNKIKNKFVDDVAFNDIGLPCAQACNNYKGPSLLGAEVFQDGMAAEISEPHQCMEHSAEIPSGAASF